MKKLTKDNENLTKNKILHAAARLFCYKGYENVTTREIAKAVGINSASIYYHFPSKEDILKSLYQFYGEQRRKGSPDFRELMKLVETRAPHEVFMQTEFHYDDEIREMLDQILVTATRGIGVDEKSDLFVKENIFDLSRILKPMLSRMVELEKIKPLDIDTFIRLLTFYCFSSAALNKSPFKQGVAEFQAGMAFLYSNIVATGK